ncbi:hypothetical protein GCM10022200_29790 [Microbacterium awajiense]|uniref:Uncharacterized protein n=1 Tax=Microbacterium awajiense TaxID=415214 RepID=A0ABP7AZV9_9MICO
MPLRVDRPTSSIGSFARSFLEASVVLTLVAGVLVLVRVISVARGDIHIAYLLLDGADLVSIVLSTLLAVAPLLVLGLLVAGWFWLGWRSAAALEASPEDRAGLSTLLAPALAVAALVALAIPFLPLERPDFAALTMFAFIPGLVARPLSQIRRGRAEWSTSAYVAVGAFVAAVVTLPLLAGQIMVQGAIALDLDEPWAPTEAIVFDDGGTEVSHVVGQTDEWLTLLTDDPRAIRMVPSGTVAGRVVCIPVEWDEYNATVLGGLHLEVSSALPQCDDQIEAWMQP